MSADSQPGMQREAELRALVGNHFDFIWRLLRRMGLPSADADDVTQQVFMTALQKLESIQPGSERTYLYGVALRTLANARRKRARRREDAIEPELASLDPKALPDRALELEQSLSRLDALLRGLPDELRRVLVLTEIEELTMVEVAALESVPPGTVASRLRRARALLRERLTRQSEREDTRGKERA